MDFLLDKDTIYKFDMEDHERQAVRKNEEATIKRMLLKGYAIDEIADVLNLSTADVQAVADGKSLT